MCVCACQGTKPACVPYIALLVCVPMMERGVCEGTACVCVCIYNFNHRKEKKKCVWRLGGGIVN